MAAGYAYILFTSFYVIPLFDTYLGDKPKS